MTQLNFAAAILADEGTFGAWLESLDEAGLRKGQRSCSDWLCRANNPAKYLAFSRVTQAEKDLVAMRKGLVDARLAAMAPRDPGRIGMSLEEIASITDRNLLFKVKNALQSTRSKRKMALESAQFMLESARSGPNVAARHVASLELEVATKQALLDQVTPKADAAQAAWSQLNKGIKASSISALTSKVSKKATKAELLEFFRAVQAEVNKPLQ